MPAPTVLSENLTYEEMLPHFEIRGSVYVFEGASTANWEASSPTTIIQTDQPWYVLYYFRTNGLMNHIMDGTWKFELFLEKMGQAEFSLPQQYRIKEIPFVSRPHTYLDFSIIPKDQVPTGVYKLVIASTFKGPAGVPGPIAAFADIGLIQFYHEGT